MLQKYAKIDDDDDDDDVRQVGIFPQKIVRIKDKRFM